MKKLLYSLLIILLIPLSVKALNNEEVLSVDVEINDNVISFTGTTESDSHAVMCKLYDSNNEEVAKFSVEVSNQNFAGNFIAPEIDTYKVSCANYSGGTIVSKTAKVDNMAIYTVTFDARGGNLTSSNSVNVTHGETINIPSDPELDGKIFGGWCEDETVTTLFDFSTKITKSTTLYARWIDSTQVQIIYGGDGAFKVEFNTNNYDDQGSMGAFVTQSQRYFVNIGNKVTLTAEVPEGHHFVGWFTTHEEEDQNNPGHNIWTNDSLLSENETYEFDAEGLYINIKPVFAPNEGPEVHTITFNTMGGSSIGAIPVADGSILDLPENPTWSGYAFVWWYEDETCAVSFDPSKEIHSNLTLYAKWILEDEQRDADQIQIWATTGGKVAASYTPSNPNVYDFVTLSGDNYVENGEVVQYYINDQITAKAIADKGFRFVGWKHANTENVIPNGMEEPPKCIGEVFSTNSSYTYKPYVTVIDGDDSPLRYVCAYFEEVVEQEKYNLGDKAGNKISFKEDEGQDLAFVVADISNLTDLEISSMGITPEIYDDIKNTVLDGTKKYGKLLQYLNIMVLDENNDEVDMSKTPVNIKLVMTDDMKKYNTFKLVNFDVNDQFEVIIKDAITLEAKEIDGVYYLVGNLPHLSAYALVGDIVEQNTTTTNSDTDKTENKVNISTPKTYDGIVNWLITMIISVIGIATLLVINKKSKLK